MTLKSVGVDVLLGNTLPGAEELSHTVVIPGSQVKPAQELANFVEGIQRLINLLPHFLLLLNIHGNVWELLFLYILSHLRANCLEMLQSLCVRL